MGLPWISVAEYPRLSFTNGLASRQKRPSVHVTNFHRQHCCVGVNQPVSRCVAGCVGQINNIFEIPANLMVCPIARTRISIIVRKECSEPTIADLQELVAWRARGSSQSPNLSKWWTQTVLDVHAPGVQSLTRTLTSFSTNAEIAPLLKRRVGWLELMMMTWCGRDWNNGSNTRSGRDGQQHNRRQNKCVPLFLSLVRLYRYFTTFLYRWRAFAEFTFLHFSFFEFSSFRVFEFSIIAGEGSGFTKKC